MPSHTLRRREGHDARDPEPFARQVVNPSDDKYRRLRLSNPKIAAALVDVPGAVDALLAMGWERDANDADFLVCPKGVRVTMAEVRAPPAVHPPLSRGSTCRAVPL